LSLVPDEYKSAFIDYFFGNRSMHDIGVRLGVSESRISQRLRRAIREVRQRLCPKMLKDRSPLGLYNKRQAIRA
jgi:DNA-directed RNA polymerase specialized sigma subunit